MRKTISIIVILCCVILCFGTLAQSAEKTGSRQKEPAQPVSFSAQDTIEKTLGQAKAATSASNPKGVPIVLKQDSGMNFSEMNYTLFNSVNNFGMAGLGIGEVVRFNPPGAGWKLKGVQIVGWSGFNNTTKQIPPDKMFLIEIRDSNGDLLYRLNDIQNMYFASITGPVAHRFDIPALPISGDFFITFYDRGSMGIGMEMNNSTGNSYFIANGKPTPAGFTNKKTNETQYVNWLIRAVGE
jgi:hypothetical protein